LPQLNKLKETALRSSKYKSPAKKDIYTEFDIQKLREFEYKPEVLSEILLEKLKVIKEDIENVRIVQDQTRHILKREK